MTIAAVFWTAFLGFGILFAGLISYRPDMRDAAERGASRISTLGAVFVAASIAAFAGEHFAAGPVLAQLVPKFMPARLFFAYFVGAAHLAAALSFVAKRYVRWSSLGLAIMFALFVLLMDLPAAIANPGNRQFWILVTREGTFAVGSMALFATTIVDDARETAYRLGTLARLWTAAVVILYGIQHFLFPQVSPGVPSPTLTATWVPFPTAIAGLTGVVFCGFGLMMFSRTLASVAAARCGKFVLALVLFLYLPQFFIARGVQPQITALNFIFDTLLFGGMLLVIARAIHVTELREPVRTKVVDGPVSIVR